MTEQELIIREIVEESTVSLYTKQLEMEVEIKKLQHAITQLRNLQNPQPEQQTETVETEQYFTGSH